MNRLILQTAFRIFLGFLAVTTAFAVTVICNGLAGPGWVLKVPVWLWLCWLAGLFIVSMYAAWRGCSSVLAPLRSLNRDLQQIGAHNLDRRVRVETAEENTLVLQEHINNLLAGTNLALIQLRQYASQVAHELRAPLTFIRLRIEQAADKIDPALGEEIQRELLRLNLHVEQALFVARAEQGHLTLNRTSFDLAALLRDVVEDFQLLAEEEDRSVSCETEPVQINADVQYVRQILYSLFTNALRHGQGLILARLRGSGSLFIANYSRPPRAGDNDLGLGRRIVSALAGLHGDISMQTRRFKNIYGVRLHFHAGA